MNKKELKQKAKDDFNAKKELLSELSKSQKKELLREEKAERKEAIGTLSKEEKKAAKRYDKYYKKLKNRPRTRVIWGVLLLLAVYLIVQFGPYVGDIRALLSIEIPSDTKEAEAAREYGESVAEKISDEGLVLLENDENLLPLKEKKINVFGVSAHHFRMGGGGSGGADQSRAVSFYEGLQASGIEYNKELHGLYDAMDTKKEKSSGIMQVLSAFTGGNVISEPAPDYLTDEVLQSAKDFSDTAMIVITNMSVEAADSELSDLKLSDTQKQLLDRVTAEFDKVIIVVNSGNARELGFIEEYDSIKAALWVGTPGPRGALSIGKVLTGEINPSGRLVDTYVYDLEAHPAIVNFGDYDFDNIKRMSFLNYEESIYVGYRYFETYFAEDEEGYRKMVQYPFGYGLSYTDFQWEIVEESISDEEISIKVSVENTGDVEGKDVVQVYYSAPYYEGGIEKSEIVLAEFAKTKLLKPGEKEVLTLSFPVRDMASFDVHGKNTYVLEKGVYEILVQRNVHDAYLSTEYVAEEEKLYQEDEITGTEITAQFGYAEGELTFLSRSDFNGTYPNAANRSFTASDEVVAMHEKVPEKSEGDMPVTGADHGILLKDLKGLTFDHPTWEMFLDQFTFEEMGNLVNNGGYRTIGLERLGVKESVLLDGPAGVNFFFKETKAASYPTEVVIASTWNKELSYLWGEAIGKEAKTLGVTGWYAPAVNVHRSPLGGRNFEYFSEDPLISGKMGAEAIKGAQSQNIVVFLKHFALNEQEVNARTGVMVFADEQAIREVYLKPFEIAVKEGEATGVMSSFIHIGPKWAGGNEELLQKVLREEWGFQGVVSTDAVLGGFMDLNLAIHYGNDLMLSPLPTGNERYLKKLYRKNPVGVLEGLRKRVHNITYTLVNNTNLYE